MTVLDTFRTPTTVAAAGTAVTTITVATVAVVTSHGGDGIGGWPMADRILLPLGLLSALTAVGAGVVLARWAPRNPNGLRFVALGGLLGAWFGVLEWSSPNGPVVTAALAGLLRPLLYLAVLAWPTGHLAPRWGRRLGWVMAGAVTLSVLPLLLNTGDADQGIAGDGWLPRFGSPAFGLVVTSLVQLHYPAAAAAVLVAIAHRRSRLPAQVRRLTTPGVAAGVVAAGADLWLFALDYVARPVARIDSGVSMVGFLALLLDYTRFGFVPLLFVVDAARRRRAGMAPVVTVDLDRPTSVPPADGLTAMVSEATGDPDLRLVWRHGGSWVDDGGVILDPDRPGRRLTVFVGPDGADVAAIYHADRPIPPSLLAAVAAGLASTVERRRARAGAAAGLSLLRAQQRALIDAQDQARHRLERNLHDGAQQQLVGLALQAGLDARRPGTDRPVGTGLAGELEQAAEDLVAVVTAEEPAALAAGLGPALSALATGCPVPATVTITGDGPEPGGGPAATTVWYLACEAVTNAVKHARADHVWLRLHQGTGSLHLTVTDDGIGGMTAVPPSLARRAAQAGAQVTVGGGRGGGGEHRGTVVEAVVPLAATAGVGR